MLILVCTSCKTEHHSASLEKAYELIRKGWEHLGRQSEKWTVIARGNLSDWGGTTKSITGKVNL